MKEKTLNILEYDKVIDMLMEKAGSEMTRKVISELKPFDDVSQIRECQGETTEAVRLISYKGPLLSVVFMILRKVFHLRLKAVPLRWRSFCVSCTI